MVLNKKIIFNSLIYLTINKTENVLNTHNYIQLKLVLIFKIALATLNIEEGTIIWYSKDEVYWERNNLSVFDKMQLTLLKLRKKIHFNRISRGIELFTHERDNQSKNITHLVFVVHGIAQKLDRFFSFFFLLVKMFK